MPMGNFDLREPGIDIYLAGLDAADRRWARESLDIAASTEMQNGCFEPHDAIVTHGMVVVPGSGDYEGWKLSGYEGKGPRDGYHLTAPAPEGGRYGPVVGFVMLNRDGTWTTCHDAWNHRPGVGLGKTGTRTTVPSAEAAYRDVVVRQTRHEARHQGP